MESWFSSSRQTPTLSASEEASIRDGMAYATMVGTGEQYLSAFAVFLQATVLQIGFLATFPVFFGSLFQALSVKLLETPRDRRKFLKRFVFAQAFLWLPVALVPYFMGQTQWSCFIVIALVTAYFAIAGLISPIWCSLIGDLIPEDRRGTFFGIRNRGTAVSTLFSFLLAGGVLHLFSKQNSVALGFAIIFLLAFLSRMLSGVFLTRHENPTYPATPDAHFSLLQFIRRTPQSNFAKFVFYLGMMNFAVSLAGPYFGLYMLRDLEFTYLEFTAVSATITVSQFFSTTFWGKLIDKHGCKKILAYCGWGIVIPPFLWLFPPHVWYLMLVQVFSGFVWSGFNLATTTFVFEAASREKRARCAAYQAMIAGFFTFLGSLGGALIVNYSSALTEVFSFSIVPKSWLLIIFCLSGFLRGIVSSLFLKHLKDTREVRQSWQQFAASTP